MKHLHLLICGVGATWLLAACAVDPEDLDPGAARELAEPASEPAAPPAPTFGMTPVPTAADKVELDPAGKTKCDGGNEKCFAADKDHCKEGDYTGACWCTHCEGGNICETETDHAAHDDKCKLKAAADEFVLDAM